MSGQMWNDDQHLLDDLAEAVAAVQPHLETVTHHARAAYSWRTVDEELLVASLSFDSFEDRVAVRRAEPGDSRTLVFTAEPLSIELEVSSRGVLGQVVPPGEAEIQIEASDGTISQVTADDLGFFVLPAVPEGSVRLRCETGTGKLMTDWVRL